MEAILFDVMGTLVYDPIEREIPEFFGMSLRELVRVTHPTAWVEFEHGRLTEEAFLSGFFADGRGYDHAAFRAKVRGAYRYLDGVVELLDELATRGVPMHTLSNYPSWWRWIEEDLRLSRWVKWSFVSYETGLRKPSPETYLHAVRTLGLAPGDCLFVDDREVNCAAAREVGLPAIRFTSVPELRAALAPILSG